MGIGRFAWFCFVNTISFTNIERDRLAPGIFRSPPDLAQTIVDTSSPRHRIIVSLSLSRHSPADDNALVDGGRAKPDVIEQREAYWECLPAAACTSAKDHGCGPLV